MVLFTKFIEWCSKLASNDCLAVLGDNDFDTLSAFKLVSQNLSTKQSRFPANQAWCLALATCWKASAHFILAACARVLNTPSDFDWRWRNAAHWRRRNAAYWSWAAVTCVSYACLVDGPQNRHGEDDGQKQVSHSFSHFSINSLLVQIGPQKHVAVAKCTPGYIP
jgi:hypothetical protein